jgi:chaperone required for assembly of F1-ATPase
MRYKQPSMAERKPVSTRLESTKALPRRFYTTASIAGDDRRWAIHLDGKPLRTPLKVPLQLPTRALAEAVVAEWQAQTETLDPLTMPLTKLANTAIDRVEPNRPRIIGEIVKFAGSDLVCYRATEPARLRARQAAAWDGVLTWAQQALDARFEIVSGLVFRAQPAAALNAVRDCLAGRSCWALAAIHNMTTLTGSALLALMVTKKAITGARASSAAHVDEDWQIEHWGADAEAEARRAARGCEFDAAVRFLERLD